MVNIARRSRRPALLMKNKMRFSSHLEHDLSKFVAAKGVSSKMAAINENTQFVLADLTGFVVINGSLIILLSCR